jgi:hypothetical protein
MLHRIASPRKRAGLAAVALVAASLSAIAISPASADGESTDLSLELLSVSQGNNRNTVTVRVVNNGDGNDNEDVDAQDDLPFDAYEVAFEWDSTAVTGSGGVCSAHLCEISGRAVAYREPGPGLTGPEFGDYTVTLNGNAGQVALFVSIIPLSYNELSPQQPLFTSLNF